MSTIISFDEVELSGSSDDVISALKILFDGSEDIRCNKIDKERMSSDNKILKDICG